VTDFTTRVWNGERIYMVEFGRAKTGSPHMKFPDVDDIGFQDDGQPNEHGQVVSTMNGLTDVRVKFHRAEISRSAPLYLVSEYVVRRPLGLLISTAERNEVSGFACWLGIA